jgi:MoaA/NifB/PqqE/SkfB family radical SAM enzyme
MKLDKTIRIYGHRPDLSFRTMAGRNFFQQEFKLKALSFLTFVDSTINIYLNRYNLFYLSEMLAYCYRYRSKQKAHAIHFNFHDLLDDAKGDLFEIYRTHIERLNTQFNKDNVYIFFEDDGVKELFNVIQKKIKRSQWKEFLERLSYVKQHSINLNDELRVLGVLLERTFIGPVDLVLDLIHVCNANCVHCWIHSPNASKRLRHDFKRQAMALETVKTIVDDADRIGINGITLLGDGEPLLHPDFIDILKHIKKKNLFMEAITFTNGFCLHQSMSRALINAGLNQLICSLPAATPETYAQICSQLGGKGFFQIIENLKILHRMKQRRTPHALIKRRIPEVTLAFVLHRLNYHEICDMATLAGEVGADNLRYQLIHLDDDNQHLKLEPDHLLFLKRHVHEARRIATRYQMKFQSSLSFQLDHMNVSKGDWSENIYLEKGCFIGWTFSVLKADGDLGLCCALKKIGNITNHGYRAAWESERYHSYRVGAKYLKANADMLFEKSAYQKEKNGRRFFSAHCQHCDNHDQNNYMLRLLEQSGLSKYLAP